MDSQGLKAKDSGVLFEDALRNAIIQCDRYTVVKHDVFMKTSKKQSNSTKSYSQKNKELIVIQPNSESITSKPTMTVRREVKFTDLDNNESRMDFVFDIVHNDVKKTLWIECKCQNVPGSVSTKIRGSCAILSHLAKQSTHNYSFYVYYGKEYLTTRMQNILRNVQQEYPQLTFVHITNINDFEPLLRDYVDKHLVGNSTFN